jgi:hypothetical protein
MAERQRQRERALYGLASVPDLRAVQERLQRTLDSSNALSALTDSRIRALLVANKVAEVGTGINAHYKFEGVRPGRYVLFGEWDIGDESNQWWAPIELASGRRLVLDLNNAVEAADSVYCGLK